MSFAVLKYMQEEIDKKTEKTVYYFLREFCDCIKESDMPPIYLHWDFMKF